MVAMPQVEYKENLASLPLLPRISIWEKRANKNHREFALRLRARHFTLELTHESVELFWSWSDYRQQDVA